MLIARWSLLPRRRFLHRQQPLSQCFGESEHVIAHWRTAPRARRCTQDARACVCPDACTDTVRDRRKIFVVTPNPCNESPILPAIVAPGARPRYFRSISRLARCACVTSCVPSRAAATSACTRAWATPLSLLTYAGGHAPLANELPRWPCAERIVGALYAVLSRPEARVFTRDLAPHRCHMFG